MRRTRRIALALAFVTALGASGLVCARVAERGRWALPYSTLGAGPEGTRALYLLASREGRGPARWTEDLGALPGGGMLVALGGCEHLGSRPLARPERERLVRWVEEGGTLVVAGAPDVLPSELGISMIAPGIEECFGRTGIVGMVVRSWRRAADDGVDAAPPDDARDPDDVSQRLARDPAATAEELAREDAPPPLVLASAVGAPLDGMAPIGMRRPARLVVGAGVESHELLRLEDGTLAGVEVSRGRGRVIALAAASPLTNRDLASAGGAALFSRLARAYAPSGPVYFDEYHLGAGARRGFMRWVAELGMMPLALQGLVVVLFFLWRAGVRFGGTRAEIERAPSTSATLVEAVGGLFAASEDRAGALAIVARHALGRVAAHHRLEGIAHDRLGEELARLERAEAAAAVARIAQLADGEGRFDLARRAQEIDAEVARATREGI